MHKWRKCKQPRHTKLALAAHKHDSSSNDPYIMKKFILTLTIACAAWSQTFAQSSETSQGLTTFDRFNIDAALSVGTKQHNVTPLNASLNVGYEFVPRLYAFAHIEKGMAFQKTDNVRTYYGSSNLGGGLGFRLLGGTAGKYAGKLRECLDLRFMAGSSVGSCDWKQTFYDANLQYYYRGNRMACTPTLSIGYRFTDSRSEAMRNQHTLYFAIGLRF